MLIHLSLSHTHRLVRLMALPVNPAVRFNINISWRKQYGTVLRKQWKVFGYDGDLTLCTFAGKKISSPGILKEDLCFFP